MKLTENIGYMDMKGLIRPTVHVDEFISKIADDADMCVLSFYVKGQEVAEDLVEFFERGYDFIIDADMSPGEIKPNRFLVYVEIQRRARLPKQIFRLVSDLKSLCGINPEEWEIRFKENRFKCDIDLMEQNLITSPVDYRRFQEREDELDILKRQSGIDTQKAKNMDSEIRDFAALAGL